MKKKAPRSATKKSAKAELSGFPIVGIGASAGGLEALTKLDLMNLLTSIEIPIVMVGTDALIRRFTPRAGKMLKLIPTDIGRSIGDIKPEIDVQNLEELVIEVMDTMITKEIETQDRNSNWYKLQVRPYRTAENKIDGAVVSLVDIDALKRSLEELRLAHEDALTTIETMPIPLLIITADLKVKLANHSFYEKFLVTRNETEGRLISALGNGQWNNTALLQFLDRTIKEKIHFDKFEIEHNFTNIGKKIILISANSAHLPGSGSNIALVAIEDITEIRLGERRLKSSEEKYLNLLTSSYEGIMVLRQDGTIEFANPQLEKIFGYEPSELLGKSYEQLLVQGEPAEQMKASVRLDGVSILAVDDNEDNRVLFSIILKSLGADVRLAESAAEALSILNDYSPDIILSDISMPGEDGFSLLKKIRQKEAGQKRKTPVIALTAHAGQEDIKRVLDAGFSAHIAKPVEKTLLSNVIKKLTSS